MSIADEQLKKYEEDGLVLLPCFLSAIEVRALKREIPRLFNEDSPRRVVERNGRMVRSVYGSHLTNDVFSRLTRHPRLVAAARRIIGGDVYVYQLKINAKAAFGGDIWEWHQDYIFWRDEDGMPSPRVTSVTIFLDEVTEFNGPLFLIPGSHAEGVVEVAARNTVFAEKSAENSVYRRSPKWISNLTADLKYSLDAEQVAGLIERHGIVSPKGAAGSALFFHGNTVHASTQNISPYSRLVVIITYNSTENVPPDVENPRPEFLRSRNSAAIVPLSDDPVFV